MKTFLISSLIVFLSQGASALSSITYLEPLMGVMTLTDGVHIQTKSSGCTFKRSFIVKKEVNGDLIELSFVRVERDPCLAFYDYGTVLSYSFEELGLQRGDKFAIRNPVGILRVR